MEHVVCSQISCHFVYNNNITSESTWMQLVTALRNTSTVHKCAYSVNQKKQTHVFLDFTKPFDSVTQQTSSQNAVLRGQ